MSDVLTAEQMRAVEQAAFDSGRATGLDLMERAGRRVVEAVFDEWPDLAAGTFRAVVLCGPGNNGGDGFVIARLLKQRGWEVGLYLYGDPARLPQGARTNCQRWNDLGEITPLTDATWPEGDFPGPCALLVDALFGTGLSRPVNLPLDRLGAVQGQGGRIVAVDLPTGLCSDSGRVIGGVAVQADLTVTFHRRKLGHIIAGGPDHCGKTVVSSIGVEDTDQDDPGARVQLVSPPFPGIGKAPGQHKYAHGHALILSGGPGRTGAARLAARAALRIGAGLVTLGVPPAAQFEVASHITAVMLRRIKDAPDLEAALEDRRLNALCLGPGLGTDRAPSLVAAACAAAQMRPMVLDADALTGFQDAPEDLFALLHPTCVLTPHGGEFRRLFPDLAARLAAPAARGPAYSKVDAVRAAADRAGCVVLLKGADTVIAGPDGRCLVHSAHDDRAAPWLATAGSGDVLAGMITGLLARGLPPLDAASAAAWLHVETARLFGPGVIAEDLPEQLPQVLRNLEIPR